MTEHNDLGDRTPAGGPVVRTRSRRDLPLVDPGDVRRRRLLLLGTLVAIVVVVAAYVFVTAGRPPDGPVRELAVFGAAVDDRDVDTVIRMWAADPDGPDPRDHVTALFGKIGERGMTPRAEPPRVRKVDAKTFRAIHRIGEVDLESRWVWDGAQFHLTAFDFLR